MSEDIKPYRLSPRLVWSICPTCQGDGKSSAHLGAFSADEFHESFDDEEAERYIHGEYDRQCDRCQGTGKVSAEAVHREVDPEDCDAEPCRCQQCQDTASSERRQDRYTSWCEDGRPGSFSDY